MQAETRAPAIPSKLGPSGTGGDNLGVRSQRHGAAAMGRHERRVLGAFASWPEHARGDDRVGAARYVSASEQPDE
jgi:hypothetical protein